MNLSAKSAYAQENDPNLGKLRPQIEFCENKLIPGIEPESPFIVFIDQLKTQIGNPNITREGILNLIKVGFAAEYFHQPAPPPIQAIESSYEQEKEGKEVDPILTPREERKYELPPGISKWSKILKLDDCLDYVKNVVLPKTEWEEICIEIKMPKTLEELKSKISLNDEIEFLKYLQRNDHKTSRINGRMQKVILEDFNKDLVIGHYARASIQSFEKKAEKYYRHFASETYLIDKYWQHPKAVKKFAPETLSRTIWNVTHVIPAYPGYLSQKMEMDPKGVKGPLGNTMKIKFGVYDSGDSASPYTATRLINWTGTGAERNVEFLGYNPGPNGSSDFDTISLSVYAGNIAEPSPTVIEYICYLVGEPPNKLVCRGKTKNLANPVQPYSQAMKNKNAFLMIFSRED
ncbi:MAG: hypothetical protein KA715_09830 [Xanthomonadaceae bacterium]|nr:hypothetical protein [Xanthomonadaceae bacterium]